MEQNFEADEFADEIENFIEKKEHVKACPFLQKLLRYDSNENFSNNIMMQLDCDVEFTSVTKRTVW